MNPVLEISLNLDKTKIFEFNYGKLLYLSTIEATLKQQEWDLGDKVGVNKSTMTYKVSANFLTGLYILAVTGQVRFYPIEWELAIRASLTLIGILLLIEIKR